MKNNLSSAPRVVYAIDARPAKRRARSRTLLPRFHSRRLFVSFNADLVFPRGLERSMTDVIQCDRTMDRRHTGGDRARPIARTRQS